HLGGEIVDLDLEVVEKPHRRNRDDQTERGGDERFRYAGRNRGQSTGAGRSHGGERVHDSHGGAKQSNERRRSTYGRQNAEAALEVRNRHQHLAFDGASSRVNVGDRDRTVLNQRTNLGQSATKHARDVRLLVLVRQSDCFGQVVLFEELRELGRELARLTLRLAQIPPLLDGDRERPDRHEGKDKHNALREVAHLVVNVE